MSPKVITEPLNPIHVEFFSEWKALPEEENVIGWESNDGIQVFSSIEKIHGPAGTLIQRHVSVYQKDCRPCIELVQEIKRAFFVAGENVVERSDLTGPNNVHLFVYDLSGMRRPE